MSNGEAGQNGQAGGRLKAEDVQRHFAVMLQAKAAETAQMLWMNYLAQTYALQDGDMVRDDGAIIRGERSRTQRTLVVPSVRVPKDLKA